MPAYPRTVPLEQRRYDRSRLCDRLGSIALVDTKVAQPAAACEPQERPPPAFDVERSDLRGDLNGMHGEGVQAGGADRNRRGRPGHREQGGQRVLEVEISRTR